MYVFFFVDTHSFLGSFASWIAVWLVCTFCCHSEKCDIAGKAFCCSMQNSKYHILNECRESDCSWRHIVALKLIRISWICPFLHSSMNFKILRIDVTRQFTRTTRHRMKMRMKTKAHIYTAEDEWEAAAAAAAHTEKCVNAIACDCRMNSVIAWIVYVKDRRQKWICNWKKCCVHTYFIRIYEPISFYLAFRSIFIHLHQQCWHFSIPQSTCSFLLLVLARISFALSHLVICAPKMSFTISRVFFSLNHYSALFGKINAKYSPFKCMQLHQLISK